MANITPWTCHGCEQVVETRYCPSCGERSLDPRELTFHGLLNQALQAFTDIDGRLIRSIRFLINRPGALTNMYLRGQRQSLVGPFALFLIANVLFVAMESLTSSHVFSSPLHMHLHRQAWSPYAQVLVAEHLLAVQTTLEAYAPLFDRAVAVNARSLIILMVVPLALLPPLLFHSRRLPFAAHLVFSLHFHAFMLVLFSFALVVPAVDELLGGPGLKRQALDDAMSVVLLLSCAGYLYMSAGTVYGTSGVKRAFQSATLVVAAAGIVLGYRFLLLLITLYSA